MWTEAVLTDPNGAALNTDQVTTGTNTFLRKAQCTGEVRLIKCPHWWCAVLRRGRVRQSQRSGAVPAWADRRRLHFSEQGTVRRRSDIE